MAHPTITIFPDAHRLAEAAAARIIACAAEALTQRNCFTLVLAGGSTPERTYRLLAEERRAALIDWSRTLIFFGDERFVPADDPRSNFGLAQRTLLAHIPIPSRNIFPMPTTGLSAEAGADAYAAVLKEGRREPFPRFDLILLGLGDDGHTASLFPGAAALDATDAWVVASPPGVLPPPVDRITLTFPVLNAARRVLFLVSGASKAKMLRDVLKTGADLHELPAAGIAPSAGTVEWCLDEAAAAQLPSGKNMP